MLEAGCWHGHGFRHGHHHGRACCGWQTAQTI
jgi:hypothetical protein